MAYKESYDDLILAPLQLKVVFLKGRLRSHLREHRFWPTSE